MSMNNKDQEESFNSGALTPDGAGIDFSGVDALANNDFKRDSFWKKLGIGILETLVKILLFIFGIILDVLRAFVSIFVTVFKVIVHGSVRLGRFFRDKGRIWRETDKWGRLNFFFNGIGYLPYKQYFNGVIFLATELAFILYMIFVGGPGIYNFILLGNGARGLSENPYAGGLPQNSSVRFMIVGIVTFIVIAAYIFVYFKGLQGGYDMYLIAHMNEYKQAYNDARYVLENRDQFEEDLTALSRKKIERLMFEKYGYSLRSARFISYVDFKLIPEKPESGFSKAMTSCKMFFYRGYDKVRNRIASSPWSNIFAKYLFYYPKEKPVKRGYSYVHAIQVGADARFHHTYDKYNDYLPWTRNQKVMMRVMADPELLLKAAYAEDEVSARNGVAPIARGSALKPKEVGSRIVGVFECELETAMLAGRWVSQAVKAERVGKGSALDLLAQKRDDVNAQYERFVETNMDARLEHVHSFVDCLEDYQNLAGDVALGKRTFINKIRESKGLTLAEAKEVYRSLSYVAKLSPEEAASHMELRLAHAKDYCAYEEETPLHPAPLTAKKQIKAFADERFAVTVMALPVLGAVITVIIPFIFSIFLAFTNWDGIEHATNNFDWANVGFPSLFSMGSGGLLTTFVSLLVWTLVWAFFATFLNYIFGIILALLINKKGIYGKSFWRTIFVISIAVPQFITLLGVSILFSDRGAINTFLGTNIGWLTDRDWGGFVSDGFVWLGMLPKIMIIVINCWVGIPYTMLSTSGILMNIPEDLYESARIDGANTWTQFWKITMPYVLFVTGPSLLTTFIGNINNFNVIYFLTGGGPDAGGALNITTKAQSTDLLITWLYKITVTSERHQYYLASAIGCVIFIVCAFFSLIMYSRMGSTQNEEEFQ